jgi:hypothetical protein
LPLVYSLRVNSNVFPERSKATEVGMKLRFLIVSALALAFMVPVALANDSTDGDGTKEDVHVEVKDEKAHDKATEGDKKYDEKKKYEESKKYDDAKAKKHKKHDKYNKHKKHAMKKLCRPRVGIYVRGELVSVDAEAGMFTVAVNKANRHGKRFLDEEATFKLAKKGKIRKHGRAALADLKPGMLVKVKGRACRSEIRDENETPDLYAKHVKVKYLSVDDAKVEKKTDKKAEDNEDKPEEKADGSNEEPEDEKSDDAS